MLTNFKTESYEFSNFPTFLILQLTEVWWRGRGGHIVISYYHVTAVQCFVDTLGWATGRAFVPYVKNLTPVN